MGEFIFWIIEKQEVRMKKTIQGQKYSGCFQSGLNFLGSIFISSSG